MTPVPVKRRYSNYRLAVFLSSVLLMLMCAKAWSVTPAGVIIRSQAHAMFLDEYGTRQQTLSNEVQTLIQAAPGVDLSPEEQNRLVDSGGEFTFSHVLTNTGNVAADYMLSAAGVRFYEDTARNGQVSSGQQIDPNNPVSLAPGESFYFLVSGVAPISSRGDGFLLDTFTINAKVINSDQCASAEQQGVKKRCFDTNTDNLILNTGVRFNVTKTMDKIEAYTGDEVTVTFSYKRMDNSKEDDGIIIRDILPPGLDQTDLTALESSFKWRLGDRGRWKLPKENAQHDQCSGIDDLGDDGFCIARFDRPGQAATGQERRVDIALGKGLLKRNQTVSVQFTLKVQPGYEGQTIKNYAQYSKLSSPSLIWEETNRVPLTILANGVAINGSRYSSASNQGEPVAPKEGRVAVAGSTITFENYLWNTGNTRSDYTVSLSNPAAMTHPFPDGSLFCFAAGEDASCEPVARPAPITVEQLEPDTFKVITVRVKLPDTGRQSDQGYEFKLLAELKNHPNAVQDDVLNRLDQWTTAASVDLTLNESLKGNSTAAGSGPNTDPKAPPAKVDIHGQAVIDKVFINNTGGVADSYNLSFEAVSGTPLPKGFTLNFVDKANGTGMTNSGVIPANLSNYSFKAIKVVVTVPADTAPGLYPFVIKVVSLTTGAADSLPLVIEVVTVAELALEPSGQRQALPGSFVTFPHKLTNNGNTDLTGITVTLSDTLTGKSWQSVLYEDTAGDAQLSSGDPIISAPFDLKAGMVKYLIVKVFAPTSAMQGAKNVTTVTALWNGDQTVSVTDTTTVNNSNVVITKEQAAVNCDTNNWQAKTFSRTGFSARPGTCVAYKLTAINRGAETVNNVVIADAAPGFTVFYPPGGPFRADGATDPTPTPVGNAISATWASLDPGASVVLYFGIKIQ